MAATPPVSAGPGRGPRWFGFGAAGSAPGEEVVIGAGGGVPLHPLPSSVVHDLTGEAAVVHDRVVPLAEQGGVGQVGWSEVGPVDQMMSVRPGRWGIATGVGAAAVAQPQPAGLGLGEEPHRPTPVQDLAGGAEDDRDDGSVAGEAADGLGGEVGAGVQPAEGGGRPDPVLERVEVHGQQQGGLVGLADLAPCCDGPADQGHQGVATAPARSSTR